MSAIEQVDLHIRQGATFKKPFEWTYRETPSDPYQAMDLTDCEVRMQIRPYRGSDELILDVADGGYITISDPVNGKVDINIPESVTKTLSFERAEYDIEIVFPNGDVFILAEGRVKLTLGVTK